MMIRVYPEYFEGDIIGNDLEIFGKLTSCRLSRMYLTKDEQVVMYYDKIGCDGRNIGGPSHITAPIWFQGDLAIAMICCMDVQNPHLLRLIKTSLNECSSNHKVVAISAHMTSDWFPGEKVSGDLLGFHVVVSNGNMDGVRSFIATPDGAKHNVSQLKVGPHLIQLSKCNLEGT